MGFVLRLIADFALPVIVAAIGVWIAFAIVVWATGRDTLLDLSPAGAPLGLGEGEAVSEAAVASVRFDTGMRGYRTDQVDAALNRLAWEIGRKDEQLAVLQARLDGTYEEAEDEPFGGILDEDTYRLANESVAQAMPEARPGDIEDDLDEGADVRTGEDDPGSEAGREDDGEATPRAGA
ncbi:DivIVA domain-containing protein [Glycomyces harbinensis]|uniref:DivIVA domain-containing protein n=1 Tax=Glycomyces harbinensis TaxID=58114 RepID=A0A1G6TNM2_9ACTN|nr:DivIVA domain-containing protein [Glycomyces harbinensis]SDD29935.1 DivIVA domain-containing protein [Glycomyces harbinensis]